jgi:hypothetical protein
LRRGRCGTEIAADCAEIRRALHRFDLQSRQIATEQGDLRAFGGQGSCDGPTEYTARAAEHHTFATELQIHK